MILKVHVHGACPYDIGDEIWQEPLADVIAAEAETIAGYAGSASSQSAPPRTKILLPQPERLTEQDTEVMLRS
jgi:hypothetical protein